MRWWPAWALLLGVGGPAAAQSAFSYTPPGELWPLDAGTARPPGKGRPDTRVYAPQMRFPVEKAPAYANSQVWGMGGLYGPGGRNRALECHPANFSYPWHDNYCEYRTRWTMPLCPTQQGHQGQDIRGATCQDRTHWAAAAADGVITTVAGYEVSLMAADGTRFRYLHMRDVVVTAGQKVRAGDRLGKLSDNFDGSGTTIHLHFDVEQNVAGLGRVWVPGYLSLVHAYERLLDGGQPDGGDGGASLPDSGHEAPDAGDPRDAGGPVDAGQEGRDAGLEPGGEAPGPASGGCQTSAGVPSGLGLLGVLLLPGLAGRRQVPRLAKGRRVANLKA